MARIDHAIGRPAGAGQGRMLQSLYEAARREVFADPAAAVRKYQPTWQFTVPSAARKAARHR
jgi:hypothetical protein